MSNDGPIRDETKVEGSATLFAAGSGVVVQLQGSVTP